MLDTGCTNSRPGRLRVLEMMQTDGPGFSLCAAPLKSMGLLSDGTIHGDIWRTGVGRKRLGFNLCVVPSHDRVVPDFRVTEITEVFWSTPEKTEETRGSRRWVHYS